VTGTALERPRSTAEAPIWKLGFGAFGLAFAITTTAAYLPPLLGRFTDSTTLIALVLGAEGVVALLLPAVIGPWSDTFHTPLGRRRPFMLAALGPLAFCLALLAFMPSIWTMSLLALAFFFAYYVYEPPYRGLYPDVLPEERYAASQSAQHVLRGIALGIALVGGGFLFAVWEPAPFVVASVVATAACAVPVAFVRENGGFGRVFRGVRAYLATSWHVLRGEPEVRRFLIANSAWEGSFAAARSFVVLYVVVGVDQSRTVATLVLAAVAGGYLVGASISGRLAGRFGITQVIFGASFVYGGGYVLAGLAQRWHDTYLAAIFVVAIGGGLVMTLAWGLLFTLMPKDDRGTVAGLATATKGAGLLLGPVLAGATIDIAAPYLETTEGFQVLWPICGLPILFAIPLVARLMSGDARRE
jgi:MFS family permease